ncbi:hypothetical protein DFH07DRAFT_758942 [Mycena maculata]|uniref:F-box domain-containing protein n=1 Tax=Mycena maculata TaxID=230809 RepID=A0AAD7H6E9_9AGAR|nr:hypothetical protein DFH07DRAFT_763320 [Mycena maculata]KAJ7724600.1 hypothetical protein DFH07DRAFT_758942 [Mycena maculata]
MASGLRSRFGAVEQRIAALESEMVLLRNEREDILGELRAVVYPVLTLPDEITSEIFLQYVNSSPQENFRPWRPLCPMRLASVCRSWRAVALSTCRLWTYLSIGDRYTYPS